MKIVDTEKTFIAIKKFCLDFGLGDDYVGCEVIDGRVSIITERWKGILWWRRKETTKINWAFLDEKGVAKVMPFDEHKTIIYK